MPAPWKQIVREQLEMLASESEQLEYERRVPHVPATAEFVSGWFDDSFHLDNAAFREAFSTAELRELQAFSKFFEAQLGQLPPNSAGVAAWLSNPAWREVMKRAATTLQRIAV